MKHIFPILMVLLTLSCQQQNEVKDPFERANRTDSDNSNNDNLIIDGDTVSFSSNFKLNVYVADNEDIGASGKQLIETRLVAAMTKFGISGSGANPRFFVGPVVNLISKNVTATSPTKYLNTYEITLHAVDALNQTIFSSYAFSGKGVGDSPDKACINAFQSQKFDNAEFYKFLKTAEEKILNYYNQNCDVLIQEAEAEAKIRNYSSAFNVLNNIPKECSECFKKVSAKRVEYFQMNLNNECQSILANMKSELGKYNDASASGFNDAAMNYYALIDRQSSCFPEAEKLYNNHMKKMSPKARRDWDLQMKNWEKQVEMADKEFDLKRDKEMGNLEYLKFKEEMAAKAEIEGNKKLLQKYNYDELPWLRKLFTPRQHVD
ncbi:MAG: hypothetical protein FJZ80_09720 [Bacteroidetes bacterium]|nr:hypothetical protein [Bacteroidota bacterium]